MAGSVAEAHPSFIAESPFPQLDLIWVIVACTLGVIGLLFNGSRSTAATTTEPVAYVRPAVLLVGAAIAFGLPLLVLAVLFAGVAED